MIRASRLVAVSVRAPGLVDVGAGVLERVAQRLGEEVLAGVEVVVQRRGRDAGPLGHHPHPDLLEARLRR